MTSGVYKCAGCGNPLFSSTAKFIPPTGTYHASFYSCLPSALDIEREEEREGGDAVCRCVVCAGFVGTLHANEGFATPTDERFAVNSDSVSFTPVGFAQDGSIDTRLIAPQFRVYRTVFVVYYAILTLTLLAGAARLAGTASLPDWVLQYVGWAL
jgi:peptide methionine sulfoxide reductase MsrB